MVLYCALINKGIPPPTKEKSSQANEHHLLSIFVSTDTADVPEGCFYGQEEGGGRGRDR